MNTPITDALLPRWMSDLVCSPEDARAVLISDADGWRHVYPEDLGHLSAAAARAQLRTEAGHSAETPEEAANFAAVLREAGYTDDPIGS